MSEKRSDTDSEKKGHFGELRDKGLASLVSGIVGLLIGALSPIGDWAEDRVDALIGTDKVSIVGTLHRNGAILSDADVVLRHSQNDDTFNDRTNSSGQYQFTDTREGSLYEMDVRQGDVTILLGYVIPIPEDENPYELDVIDIARVQVVQQEQIASNSPGEVANQAFQIDREVAIQDPGDQVFHPGGGTPSSEDSGPDATPSASPTTSEPEIAQLVYDTAELERPDGTAVWNVNAGIEIADPSVEIQSVTYYLDPAYQPSVVTRTVGPDYRLAFEATESFELAAIVTLSDGRLLELTTYLDLGS